MVSFDIWYYVQLAIGLLLPVMATVCGVVCIVYRRLSAWLTLVALGFLGEAFLGIVDRAFWFVVLRDSELSSHTVLQLFSLGSTFGYILGLFLIMLGLVLGLSDIQRRMSRLREATGEMRDRMPAQEAREPWRPRQEGSPDIQR
jgi:hypothetical protein